MTAPETMMRHRGVRSRYATRCHDVILSLCLNENLATTFTILTSNKATPGIASRRSRAPETYAIWFKIWQLLIVRQIRGYPCVSRNVPTIPSTLHPYR